MRLYLILAAAFCLSSLALRAETTRIPKEVADHIEDMKASCRDAGGKPLAPAKIFLLSADLKGDGLTDWAIDEAGFNCDGAWSIFSGSGGSQIYVFAGMPGNKVRQSFMHGAGGLRLEREGSRSRLWLRVGGVLCGQAGQPTHADAIYCERPLAWNKNSETFEFAPLSAIKILDKNTPP